jgi:uncharacterized protein (DUF1778 family)
MVTQRQRVAVTLSDETREIVQRLADLEGTSMSKIVASIVESFAPTAQQLVAAMEAVKDFPEEKRRQLVAAMEKIEPELLGKADAATTAFNDALGLVDGLK